MLRGQTDNVEAPPGFELNSAWRVGHVLHMNLRTLAYRILDGETVLLADYCSGVYILNLRPSRPASQINIEYLQLTSDPVQSEILNPSIQSPDP